jgi:hypothetical protein
MGLPVPFHKVFSWHQLVLFKGGQGLCSGKRAAGVTGQTRDEPFAVVGTCAQRALIVQVQVRGTECRCKLEAQCGGAALLFFLPLIHSHYLRGTLGSSSGVLQWHQRARAMFTSLARAPCATTSMLLHDTRPVCWCNVKTNTGTGKLHVLYNSQKRS